jgi:hypothetical protein
VFIKGIQEGAPQVPLRKQVRIPCTVNIDIAALSTIRSATSNPLMAAALEASVALGYALSLRPQEYLKT